MSPAHDTVGSLLEQVKAQTFAAQERQDVPFEQVVEALAPPRSLAHTPLFQVVFAWQNNEVGDFALPGLDVSAAAAAAHRGCEVRSDAGSGGS